jgi:hypothetical protein
MIIRTAENPLARQVAADESGASSDHTTHLSLPLATNERHIDG